jgi:hypothetical protein
MQNPAFFSIGHFYPAKALFATAQAASTVAPFIGLTNAAARTGDVKKLKLLCHNASTFTVDLIEDAFLLTGKYFAPSRLQFAPVACVPLLLHYAVKIRSDRLWSRISPSASLIISDCPLFFLT